MKKRRGWDTAQLAPLGALVFIMVLATMAAFEVRTSQAVASDGGAQRYVLSEDRSLIYVTIRADPSTIFSPLAHNHVIRATHWEGVFEYDSEAHERCHLAVTIPVSGLVVDEPEMRERLGFDKPMSDAQRREIDASMRDSNQLHTARYPTIEINSERCSPNPDHPGGLLVEARVTIRGQTAATTIPIDLTFDGPDVIARGQFRMTHTDFGFEPYSAFFGTVRNSEEIDFFFHVRGRP